MKTGIRMSCVALALALSDAGGAQAQSISPVCQTLLAARKKLFTVPHHGYTTEPGGPDGKPGRTMESISMPTATYIQVKNAWRKSPMTPQDMLKQMDENVKAAKVITCKQLADEAVDGASASVFSAHTENSDTKADAKVWVSKGTGLILKEEEDIDDGFQKKHMSIRYDYKNVEAPI